jgi:hypothetical protein
LTGAGSGVGVITQAIGCIDSNISCCQTWEKIIMSDVFTTPVLLCDPRQRRISPSPNAEPAVRSG